RRRRSCVMTCRARKDGTRTTGYLPAVAPKQSATYQPAREIMTSPMLPHYYEKIVREDIDWLVSNTRDSLERQHIIAILEKSIKDYDSAAYMKAMMRDDS